MSGAVTPVSLADVERQLLLPEGPFEIAEEEVLGERLQVFKKRPRKLRDFVVGSSRFGDAEHLVFTDGTAEKRLSFREHAQRVADMAVLFRDVYGVVRGDRVAILAANGPEWIIAFWAAVSLGAIAVGLNAWWTEPEIRFGIDNAEPKLLVVDRKRFARLAGGAGVPTLVVEDDLAAMIAKPCGDASLPDAAVDEDDPAIILYTSGTTGRPKGAVHSHRNVIALVMLGFFNGARTRAISAPTTGAPCVFVTSPLFHVSGLHNAAIACLAAGVKSVWMTGRFDAKAALSIMEREKVSGWGYTAALLHRVVYHPDAATRDLSSLWQLGGGGSPIAPALQARARDVFKCATLGVGYGLTECTSLATINPGAELQRFPESVGRAMPTIEIEIRDDDGNRLADNEEGEVYVRGPLVMLEYWRNRDATVDVLRRGRWLRTGDMGRRSEGRLFLSSRKRDLILRGGENVYPAEIELRLEAHPDVAEAAVIGVDHDELGQEVKAIVVPRAGKAMDVPVLKAWVAEALAYFKVPAHWESRAAPLPRNATGKVLKHVLRDQGPSTFIDE